MRKDLRRTTTLNLDASVWGTKMVMSVSLGTSVILMQFSEGSNFPAVIGLDMFSRRTPNKNRSHC